MRLSLVEAANHERYAAHVRVGMAIYVDYLLHLRPRPPKLPDLSQFVTSKDRLKWLEHNVYWSLTTSDRYVWCYGERMDWWGTMAGNAPYGGWVPPGAAEAIESARKKVRQGRPLGFTLDKIIARAWEGRKAYKPPAKANLSGKKKTPARP